MKKNNFKKIVLTILAIIFSWSFVNAQGKTALNIRDPLVFIISVEVDGQSINVNGSQHAEVEPNQQFWIDVEIENQGSSWSGYGQLVIWIEDYDNVLDVDDNYFDYHVVYPAGSTKWHIDGYQITTSEVSVDATEESWSAGENQHLEVKIQAPSSGSIHFLVRATFSDWDWNIIDMDPWFDTGYTDEQGYWVRRYTIDVVPPPLPDLVIQNELVNGSSSSVSVLPGDELITSCRVKNIGNATADAEWVGYYWEDDIPSNLNDLENRVGRDGYPALDPGDYSDEDFNYTVPSGTTPGTYYFAFYADYQEDTPESNEDNNLEYVTVYVNGITDCYWSTTSGSGNAIPNNTIMEAGEEIYVNIHAVGFSSVDVKVYEDDLFEGSQGKKEIELRDELVDQFTVTISNGFGTHPYTLFWMDDGLAGIPEYYFKVEDNNNWKSDLVQVDDTTPPEIPELLSPANGQTFNYNQTTISFDWENSEDNNGYGSGVDYYHIQVSTNTSFTSIVWESNCNTSNASHTFDSIDTYYWHVNATDNEDNTSNYSSYRSFTIEAIWTWMLYLLEDGTGLDGADDINEWEANGSINGLINYIVLYDAQDDSYDGIYYIEQDPDGYNSTIISPIVSTFLGIDPDMSNWETLRDFIMWCKNNYPSQHYGLIMWDHGNGIFREERKGLFKGFCEGMKLWEMDNAIEEFTTAIGEKIDIVGFDLCLLGQIETVYQLKDYADYVIASENVEPGDGWDYEASFAHLNANPNMSSETISTHIVNDYLTFYGNSSAVTLSATSSTILENDLIPLLNIFADALYSYFPEFSTEIKLARNNAWYPYPHNPDHKDLGDFATEIINDYTLPNDLRNSAQDLLNCINIAVIAEAHGNAADGATGLKIWMTENISDEGILETYYTNPDDYLKFSETQWDEFLYVYEEIGVDDWHYNSTEFVLYQNYPNPFKTYTHIKYYLPRESEVKILIYNIKGQLVESIKELPQKQGIHSIMWNPIENSPGIYFYQIIAEEYKDIKKCILLK